jgi:predicted RNase H-like HicB family nuclease
MKDRYIYPAIFGWDVETSQYGVFWPDLPGCYTQGATQEQAIRKAKKAMSLHPWGMDDDGDEIPEPSDVKDILLEAGQAIVLIDAYMPLFRESMNNKAVTKTVTIPRWLEIEAKEAGLNFSRVLQDGLMSRLGSDKASLV